MISSLYNNNILKLFSESDKSLFVYRAPMIYDELKNCDILFIGINPSFIELERSFNFIRTNAYKVLNASYLTRLSLDEYKNIFFDLDMGIENVKILGDIHSVFKKNYSYFNKFKLISKELNLSIEHLDLLPIRETSQKIVSKIIEQNPIFLNNCVNIFLETVKQINPRAVVIENTLVRDILLKQNNKEITDYFPSYEYSNFKDNNFGTPVNSSGVAIFYTSMLSGQRAIDLGSYHRLLWSMNKLLN